MSKPEPDPVGVDGTEFVVELAGALNTDQTARALLGDAALGQWNVSRLIEERGAVLVFTPTSFTIVGRDASPPARYRVRVRVEVVSIEPDPGRPTRQRAAKGD